ncbi:hypothetical protein [Streptomyces sp. NBC_00140]|uniref:hypothetical protein n=1 Tax=Streptomyces sp. NBC_00140 TaxID=2975664 RepID=UPI0022520226|nr:hypothetical protein [Streptomyces sp. NBC_00140]MCX5335485.1 hypothetical protein [Streptomyces sp. NBC_00140]MCX5338335.1 hypothetical protein [Streptomyces sp. NBC_00140]
MAEIQHKIPPVRLYEVRTAHGEAYRAGGDVIEQGDGWFTLWADHHSGELSLRVPEADIRAVRQTDLAELEAAAESAAFDPQLADLVRGALGIDLASGTVPLDEVLHTACRELEKSEAARAHVRGERAALQAALERVRNLSTSPEIMNAAQEHPSVWEHGYECGVRAAKSAARIRTEEASGS